MERHYDEIAGCGFEYRQGDVYLRGSWDRRPERLCIESLVDRPGVATIEKFFQVTFALSLNHFIKLSMNQ